MYVKFSKNISNQNLKQCLKMSECSLFTFDKEDHTLGTTLQSYLLKDSNVQFAGYIVEHPLEFNFKLKIITKNGYDPEECLANAFKAIIRDLNHLEESFISMKMSEEVTKNIEKVIE